MRSPNGGAQSFTETAHPKPAGSSIYDIPSELLIAIFSDVAASQTSLYYESLRTLSAVSKSWKKIINSCPALWAFVSSDHHEHEIRQALQCSRDYPLRVEVVEDGMDYDIMTEVVNQFPRWKHASVTTYSSATLNSLCLDPAPMLVGLHLAYEGGGEDGEEDEEEGSRIDLFGGDAPKLEVLSLAGVEIPWNSRLLIGLKSLSLKQTPELPSVEKLREALHQCPDLEALELRSLCLSENGSGVEPTTHSRDAGWSSLIQFTRLQVLTVCENPSWFTASLLAGISAPVCSRIVMDDASEATLLDLLTTRLDHSMRQAAAASISLLLGNGNISIRILDEMGSPIFTIDLEPQFAMYPSNTAVTGLIETLESTLPRPLPIELEVKSYKYTSPLDIRFRIDAFADRFPDLTSLSLVVQDSSSVGDSATLSVILKYLSEPQRRQGEDSELRWPYSHLKRLRLRLDGWRSDQRVRHALVNVPRSRLEARTNAEHSSHAPIPAAIESVVMCGRGLCGRSVEDGEVVEELWGSDSKQG